MENLEKVITQIQEASGIREVAEVTTLTGDLEGVGTVEITIRDRGANNAQYRYSVWGRTLDLEKQRTAVSNAGPDLETVIATTHWYALKP